VSAKQTITGEAKSAAKSGLPGAPGCQTTQKLKIVTVNSNFGDLWQFGHYWQLVGSLLSVARVLNGETTITLDW
jgi:hypothetical protein